jgi:hypothetical protein
MAFQRSLKFTTCLASAMAASMSLHMAARGAWAQDPIMPPLSVAKARYLQAHPAARAAFLASLPRRPTNETAATEEADPPTAGGTWTAATPAPTNGLCNPLLLTDGTVLVAVCDSPTWYKLTPDSKGNYALGTWSKVASLPVIGGTQYAPQYHASAVLPDGRVIIMGGEYNGSNTEVWTNLGAIYDPVADAWTAVTAPVGTGWTQIGDAQSVVLANGTFMLAACCGDPAADALLDPATLTWASTGGPTAGQNYQDEQGYELLPSGNVLTVDIWTNYKKGNATNAEQYNPTAGTWSAAGNTPVPLADPAKCGNWEIGPAVTRGDGKVVAFGGNTGCVAGATANPTALYDSKVNTWSAGPNVPAVCGTNKTTSCDLADAPAALEPNGSILFAASAGYGNHPTRFFEFTRESKIHRVNNTKFFAASSGAYYYNFLVLPNGQILATDFSKTVELYTGIGTPIAAWGPSIGKAPTTITAGKTYPISGKQFSGRTQGAYYGDDAQSASNYPIVRITNTATGDVTYARSSSFSKMSVQPGIGSTAKFTVPAGIETGPSTLSVIANGIASPGVGVTVR